ncbi:MAG: YmdB family metallophosphoesterase [Phycisphaerae bacterium]|nr:YmdB family metallophosphoesterase [Phycisphaerae bacterium]
MADLRIACFGDVVGAPGLRAFAHGAKVLRDAGRVDLVIVNGENSKNGSGISPEGCKELRRAGADAITLGDHVFKDRKICDDLDDPIKPIARPANLSSGARGKRVSRVMMNSEQMEKFPPVFVVTVLGRLFMPLPANDPFEAVDREVAAVAQAEPRALVIVEVHAEATSEKQAMVWHCARKWPGRVVLVFGTHTHVQTADARIVNGSLAAVSDLGMCGGHRGVIGRKIDPVLEMMTNQNPFPYEVADEDVKATGIVVGIDTEARKAISIETISIAAPA